MNVVSTSNKPLVSIITATTGNLMLEDVMRSVCRQTYKNIEHYVVIDGIERKKEAIKILNKFNSTKTCVLPVATGKDNYNGHRIYGAFTYLCNGQYIMYLDEDNWLEPEHVEALVDVIEKDNVWAYSLRNIYTQDKKFICEDNCESLGKWKSVLNDNFIDVGCWFLPKQLALLVTPLWYRRARHPQEQPEVDRIITSVLMQQEPKYDCSKAYTLNYRVGNRNDSVQAQFFLTGNEKIKQVYGEAFPWKQVDKKEESFYTITL